METPPPVTEDQRRKDNEHLGLLAVFHFVVSGLAVLGIAFLLVHYQLMSSIFAHPERWQGAHGPGPPKAILDLFAWFYLVMGVMFASACLANLLSGIFLRQRKYRMFSLIVAGLDCVQIPVGTALGVFTIIVLLRDSVRLQYEA